MCRSVEATVGPRVFLTKGQEDACVCVCVLGELRARWQLGLRRFP